MSQLSILFVFVITIYSIYLLKFITLTDFLTLTLQIQIAIDIFFGLPTATMN